MATGSEELTELGLRERKKLRTRETIVRVAFELFSKQGFAETTIKQIADAAEVAPRTVSAYFPVKEQLVFHDGEESLAGLRTRLTERLPGATAVDAMRGWIAEHITASELDLDDARCRRELIENDPALRTYERGHMARVEQIVAEAVAVDLHLPADDLIPHMVGAATVAAFDALGREMKTEPIDEDIFAQARNLIDDAMTFVGGGVQALAERQRDADQAAQSSA
jgi:AcrR family transcriptional regulator